MRSTTTVRDGQNYIGFLIIKTICSEVAFQLLGLKIREDIVDMIDLDTSQENKLK